MPLVKKVIVSVILICSGLGLQAQTGGRGVYSFLNIQASPRLSALAGAPISIHDHDPNLGFYIPSLLNSKMHRHLAVNYVNYFSDINIGQVNYVHAPKEDQAWQYGILYTNYGKFTGRDAGGNEEGTFTAGDYALQVGHSRIWNKWSAGVNAKFIISQLETYTSTGLAFDLSGSYTSDSGRFSMSLLMRNAGLQLSTYAGLREKLPFEMQWSLSKKLRHAPLRLIAVVHNLQTWDLSYINTNDRTRNLNFDGEEEKKGASFGDKAFRHVILATELVFGPNFMLRVGYNHQRRQEMTWEEGKRLTGFAFGFGIKIRRFRLDYGNAAYFPGKAGHTFSLTLDLEEFSKK